VHWWDTCPVCRGSGIVDGERRRGVSVYPRLEGLYHYMLANEAELGDCVVVELEAKHAPDVDFDADEGALLAMPSAIRACAAPDSDLMDRVRDRALQLADLLRR
jgi:hypothetical protein